MGMRASFLAKTSPARKARADTSTCRSGTGDECLRGATAARRAPDRFASAIAGVVEHLPAASLLLNPTINSYKRLVPGLVRADQRDLGLREPLVRRAGDPLRPRRAAGGSNAAARARTPTRTSRSPRSRRGGGRHAADATPPAPVEGDAYARDDLPELPGSLEAAIAAFGADDTLREALGDEFSDYYATSRAWELKAWRETVTDWERDRYGRSV